MAEKNIAAHKFSDKILDSIPCEQWFLQGRNHCSQGIDSIASQADVLRGSSRVPAHEQGQERVTNPLERPRGRLIPPQDYFTRPALSHVRVRKILTL